MLAKFTRGGRPSVGISSANRCVHFLRVLSSPPGPRSFSEKIDYRRSGPDIVLAPNRQRRVVIRGSQIVRASADGEGIRKPVVNSAANCPRVAGRPCSQKDAAAVYANRATNPGSPSQRMNVSIKTTVSRRIKNRSYQITKDVAVTSGP